MFARNFTVKLKSSLKSNFVVIPESYRRLVSTNKQGCLLLNFCANGQYKTIYVSWANTIQVSTPFEAEEIEVNTLVGEAWGLREGMNVSCSVIQNAQPLKAITISLSGEDYEMAQCSSERIQYDLLDQITIVGRYQHLVIWLNKSITVKATVDNLSPSYNYGRIQNDTEVSINRKLTQEFLRPKQSVALSEDVDSDTKMKRRSAVERADTMDISQLRRNNSFVDSRRFLEKSDVSSIRRPSNGWSDNLLDLTDKKPPLLSPRGSIKRSKESDFSKRYMNGNSTSLDESNGRLNPLSISSSLSSLKRMQEDSRDSETNQMSNSLNASNIKRVQNKSKQFLETLENAPKQQQRQIINSINSVTVPKIVNETSKNVESPAKIVEKIVSEKRQNHLQFIEDLKKTLERESRRRVFLKIHIDEKNSPQFMQINEVFVAKTAGINVNQIHKLKTKSGKEYHVRIKQSEQIEDEKCIKIHPVLAKLLEVEQSGEKVEILDDKIVSNLIEGIEIIPTNAIEGGLGHQIARDIEDKFKKYINANSRILPLIINQGQIFKLDTYLVTLKIYPLSLPVCCVDSDILRENLIEVRREGAVNEFSGTLLDEKKKKKKNVEPSSLITLDKNEAVIAKSCKNIHPPSNKFKIMGCPQNNFVLAGVPRSGKTTICNEIKSRLESRSITVTVFNCSEHKGRKIESIIRDIKSYLMSCLASSPSILLINDIDALATHTSDDQQTQEGEYLNKLSNSMRNLLEEFTHDYGNYVTILITVEKLSTLNKVIFHNFGYYLFKNVLKIPNLEATDRHTLLKKLFTNNELNFDKNIDFLKYSRVTEGYQIGDICQFADRAIFFAVKENYKLPTLTEDILNKSLAISNKLCLEGIKTDNDSNEENVIKDEKIPGMDNVIATLEEVLVWPTKFPKIFQKSPLKNQSGILLFGIPGSGKTFIVSQITKHWNLRLISVKGPELLAKYIGQSEENVRNLFEKAKSAKPCVLFFDEFDSLAPRRGHDSTGVTDRVVNQLLTELDGVKSLEGVSVICATSRPDLIDPALLRSGRIDRMVECNMPNANERFEIIQWLAKSLKLEPSFDIKKFAVKLDIFSGADIKSIFTTANMQAIEEYLKISENAEDLNDVLITREHIENAVKNTRPSMSKDDIERYKILYEKFKIRKSVTIETPKKVSLA